ncbi:hypothetical protein CDL15_Pgr021788 [Punica granatum]|uniref:Branchpoint-bridging protein n=1 Tax=Punica granatum TaxID=22663 RepID=A0A218WSL4_PUNGR|nr:hypothetical protein CDL15_Pgr021788 [Punica granatum]PKI52047.1 hypothetical protein CRG98_027463 [Punica granatum]
MSYLQANKELGNKSAQEEDQEKEVDTELEDDPGEELEEDPDEEVDVEEEDDPEEEIVDEEEDDPEEEVDDEEEDDPEEEVDDEEEEISEAFYSKNVKNELVEKSGGLPDGDEPFKELTKEPKLQSPLSCDVEDKSAPAQCSTLQKNGRQVEVDLKVEYDCGCAASNQDSHEGNFFKASDDGCSSGKQESSGSSGKRRRTRWDEGPEGSNVGENVIGDRSSKRRKTRWSSINSQIKLLGPLQLPDFTKETVLVSESDTEMQNLREELVDIDYKLQEPVIHDERPKEEWSPSPEPVYNNFGIRINTREERLRQKLIERRQHLISRLIKKQPTFKTPKYNKTPKLCKKLYVPVKQYPGYNFAGLIIGPRGNTQKTMEKESGAKISLRGSGSFSRGKHASENDDLHVLIEADNEDSLDAASKMVLKLLTPMDEKRNDHKRAQLKELAQLKQSSKERNMCYFCGAQGHQHHACPHQLFSSPSVFGNAGDGNKACSDNGTTKSKDLPLHGKGTLYVTQLPESVDDHLLKELFCPFGSLIEAKVSRDGKVGKSKGCGFVKFEDPNDAAVAASHLNGFTYKGNRLAVKAVQSSTAVRSVSQKSMGISRDSLRITKETAQPCQPGSVLMEPQAPFPMDHSYPLEGGPRLNKRADLIVSNLPDSVDENRLKDLFCPFGRLNEAKVVRDGNAGKSKGCGSVEFENPADASMALLHLNGFELEGRLLTVSWNFLGQTAWPPRSCLTEPKLPSPVFPGHGGLLPRGPSFTFTPPSTGSSSFDIDSVNSFGSSYTFSDKSPFLSLGYVTGVPGDPNNPNSQYGAYFTTLDSRPSPPSQLVHTPESSVRPIFWSLAP